MSIAKRLFIMIFSSLLVTSLVGFVGYSGISRLYYAAEDMKLQGDALVNHMNSDMMHDALRADVLGALYFSSSKDSRVGDWQTIDADLKEHIDSFRETVKENEELPLPEEIKAAISAVVPALNNYITSANDIVTMAKTNYETAVTKLPDFLKDFKTLGEKMSDVSADLEESSKKAKETEQQVAKKSFNYMIYLMIGALAFGLGCLFVVNKSVTQVLAQMVAKLKAVSEQMFNSAGQIASGGQTLAQGASEQAASLEETSATVQEISSGAKQNADNARLANQLTEEVRRSSEEGVSHMQGMSTAIDAIKKASEETAAIIKTIDDIAFQTNLLALNAAVEAARAGDAGKGFAVVAEEVRNLAQRSGAAARDTTEKIRRSKELAENGVQMTKTVEGSLQKIFDDSKKAVEYVQLIAKASNEQSAGIGQLNIAISELDKVTQSNAASSEESAAAGSELNNQASYLDATVNELAQLAQGGVKKDHKKVKQSKKSQTKIYTLNGSVKAGSKNKIDNDLSDSDFNGSGDHLHS